MTEKELKEIYRQTGGRKKHCINFKTFAKNYKAPYPSHREGMEEYADEMV